jgi:hypothetical protein
MNIMKKIILILLCLFYYAQVNGQSELYSKAMTSKIDSIANLHETKLGCIIIGREQHDSKMRTEIGEFKLDGPFLVLLHRYYNINKLMYFYVGTDRENPPKTKKVIYFVFETI